MFPAEISQNFSKLSSGSKEVNQEKFEWFIYHFHVAEDIMENNGNIQIIIRNNPQPWNK